MNKPVLVLGASEELIIPDFECKEIFTSNSSAIKGKLYKSKYKSCIHTNVTPAKAFHKIDEIKKSILDSTPDNLISRFGNIDCENYEQLKKTKYHELSQKKQADIQKKFLENKIYFYIAELKYKNNIFKKIIHLKECLTWRNFLGCSTGLFAILLALDKHPDSKIIISGIDFKGGNYFQGERRMTEGRALVDLFFLKKIKLSFKKRIFTLNKKTAERTNLNYHV